MKTQNPREMIKKSGLALKLFSDQTHELLKVYDKTMKEVADFKDNPTMMELVNDIVTKTTTVIKQDIANIKESLKTDADKKAERKIKKQQSSKIMEEVEITSDYLSECRAKLREFNRQKRIAEGKDKPIKRKLTTRLKEGMKKIVNMMPKAVKEDKDKLSQTERIINRTVSDLKKIWGMNRIEGIQKELKEKFEQLKEKAVPEKA